MVDNKIELPVSSSEAIIKYKEDYLSDIEINEIVEFSSVYYLSYKENKIKPTKAERLVNNGFDDADGYYRIVNGDQLGYRY
jgi:dual specificity tyrosine-phosphorylation-regulated kinase 2/3/4